MIIGIGYMNYKAHLQKNMINLKDNPELQKIFDDYINTNTYVDYKVNQDIHKYFNQEVEDVKDQILDNHERDDQMNIELEISLDQPNKQ